MPLYCVKATAAHDPDSLVVVMFGDESGGGGGSSSNSSSTSTGHVDATAEAKGSSVVVDCRGSASAADEGPAVDSSSSSSSSSSAPASNTDVAAPLPYGWIFMKLPPLPAAATTETSEPKVTDPKMEEKVRTVGGIRRFHSFTG